MKNTTLKKLLALLLSIALVTTLFAACGQEDAYVDDSDDKVREETPGDEAPNTPREPDTTSPTGSNNNDTPQQNSPNQKPWITEILSQCSDDNWRIYPQNFSEGYAFVYHDNQYDVIDQNGNLAFHLGTAIAANENWFFSNGLCFVETKENPDAFLVDTKGNQYTAEYFGGTAFLEDTEMLAGGYFIVDKVTTTFDGVTYESAVYNTKLEQVHPYSSEFYTIYHEEYSYRRAVYNGYIITNPWHFGPDTLVYHIETNTQSTVASVPLLHAMDLATYDSWNKRMSIGDTILLDLSRYNTLENVEFMGDFGLVTFCNEEYERYFSVIDAEGNLKFDPIHYNQESGYNNFYHNENVIITKFLNSQQNIYKINAYDWNGNLLGSLELTTVEGAHSFAYLSFGPESITIHRYDNDTICYYDFNLKPMFPIE